MAHNLKGKGILVTGGTGSIGREIIRHIIQYEPRVIRVLSNDENGLFQTQQQFQNALSRQRYQLQHNGQTVLRGGEENEGRQKINHPIEIRVDNSLSEGTLGPESKAYGGQQPKTEWQQTQ